MKRKARMTFAEAECLLRSGCSAGAANRAYYALYQFVVGIFTAAGKKPTSFVAAERLRRSAEEGVHWPHWLVQQCCGAAGLDRRQADVLEDAFALRVRADYRPEPLDVEEVRAVMNDTRGVLDDLG